MSVIIMIMIMMMIRSSPPSPPLLSPHPVRWTGDLVLKTSTITSLYQGITNMMIVMMIIDDDDDDDNWWWWWWQPLQLQTKALQSEKVNEPSIDNLPPILPWIWDQPQSTPRHCHRDNQVAHSVKFESPIQWWHVWEQAGRLWPRHISPWRWSNSEI